MPVEIAAEDDNVPRSLGNPPKAGVPRPEPFSLNYSEEYNRVEVSTVLWSSGDVNFFYDTFGFSGSGVGPPFGSHPQKRAELTPFWLCGTSDASTKRCCTA